MRATICVLLFCVIASRPACAGAWLREPEKVFVSVTSTLRYLNGLWHSENSLYGEYGLAPRLTLGVDINERPGEIGHVLVFGRIPIGSTDGRTKVALELGIGGHHLRGQWGNMLKSTVSVGRGFDSRWGNGWFNIDTAVELRRPNRDPALKLDATIGLSSGPRFRPIFQFESTYVPGSPLIWSMLPGVLIDGRNNTTWLIAVEHKTAIQTSLGLKFGLWRKF